MARLLEPEYWQETLADAPEPLEVPADRARPSQPDHAGAVVRLGPDEEVTAGLRTLGGPELLADRISSNPCRRR
jgi:hypothetical protein